MPTIQDQTNQTQDAPEVKPPEQNQEQAPPLSRDEQLKLWFGQGRYFALSCEVLRDTIRLHFCEDEAHAVKTTKVVISEFGAVMANSQIGLANIKFGKLNKDGQFTSIKEAVEAVKKVKASPGLSYLTTLQYCNSAGVNHVKGVFSLQDPIAEWVKGLK